MQIRGEAALLALQKQKAELLTLQKQLDINEQISHYKTTLSKLKQKHVTLQEQKENLSKSNYALNKQSKLHENETLLDNCINEYRSRNLVFKRLLSLAPYAEKITNDFLLFQEQITSAQRQFPKSFWVALQKKVEDLFNPAVELHHGKICLFEMFNDHLLIKNLDEPFYSTEEEHDTFALSRTQRETKNEVENSSFLPTQDTSLPEVEAENYNPFDDLFGLPSDETDINTLLTEISEPPSTTISASASTAATTPKEEYSVIKTEEFLKSINSKLDSIKKSLLKYANGIEQENKVIVDDNEKITQDLQNNALPSGDLSQNPLLRESLELNHQSLIKNQKEIDDIKSDLATIHTFNQKMIDVTFNFKYAKLQKNSPYAELQPVLDEMQYALTLLNPASGFSKNHEECTLLHLLFSFIEVDIFFQAFQEQLQVLYGHQQNKKLTLSREDLTRAFEQQLNSIKQKLKTELSSVNLQPRTLFSSYYDAKKQLYSRLNRLETYLNPRDFISAQRIKMFAMTSTENEEGASYPGRIYLWASKLNILVEQLFKTECTEKLELSHFIQSAIQEAETPAPEIAKSATMPKLNSFLNGSKTSNPSSSCSLKPSPFSRFTL